ncbi:hypothetical protein QNH23_09460 [Siminovitchia fortis]|uniref:Uncharacterized protein n=1 Tax=Siminovitchia fortis TaxID=254758 RepID=A0A443J231_9BACI|nr:hypothetical protein [Siminovitchia fortis]RWR14527.1 hypothetical protein D4N35_001740 [Siminovitchia fortis]WHY83567.1 hypothetical protein QNH23_09460 [Siminovitchia fortis]
MKTAVLFGARQPFGFELCSLLLEKGYDVFAIDHSDWITDEQEEKWLLIGRNANLRYMELENVEDSIQQKLSDEKCLYIIPTLDYLNRCHPSARNELIYQLERFSERKKTEASLLLIHPPATERSQSSFAGKLNGIFESLKKFHNVWEYCPSDAYASGLRENLSAAANDAVNYLEQQKLLESN